MTAEKPAYRTPPEEREALRRLLCEPMPPGTDYPSAVWGASQVLILLRQEKSQATGVRTWQDGDLCTDCNDGEHSICDQTSRRAAGICGCTSSRHETAAKPETAALDAAYYAEVGNPDPGASS